MSRFALGEKDFLLDNRPVRLISGAVHYFRIHPDQWVDRLNKLKQLGLNCLELYVPWNLHEPREGEYDFSGMADLERFVRLIQALDMLVILRPGPYICAEWEMGGLPPWLLRYPDMKLRTSDPLYLEKVDRWFDLLIPRIAALQIDSGGPVIMVQVENEYGSYANDKAYLKHLADGLRDRGITVPLFTSDGETDAMLTFGTLPGVHKTVNFGSRPDRAFEQLRKHQAKGPLMGMELWNGWFDHWEEEHHGGDFEACAATLEEVLKENRSVNLYMAHGGTNFGFMNGANHDGENYQPTVTSYDYDASLSESGDFTPKYHAFRPLLARASGAGAFAEPPETAKITLPPVSLGHKADLWGALGLWGGPVISPGVLSMEQIGQNYGFILYRTTIPSGLGGKHTLQLPGVRDRAQVFLNRAPRGRVYRNDKDKSLELEIPDGGARLDILVENMGRINYGPGLFDRKGLAEEVRLGRQILCGWEIFPLPLDDLAGLAFAPREEDDGQANPDGTPAFYRGTFAVEKPGDTFLALPGWAKGVAWVNGFNLGRYWEIGPQGTLYVPAPVLREGENEIILFELHRPGRAAEFRDRADLG